jgi:hypothetical protein
MVIYSIYGSLPLTLSMNGCTEKEVQILYSNIESTS